MDSSAKLGRTRYGTTQVCKDRARGNEVRTRRDRKTASETPRAVAKIIDFSARPHEKFSGIFVLILSSSKIASDQYQAPVPYVKPNVQQK